MTNATRPIGLFDSGVGGLTVFKAIGKRLPNESLIYFGDTARVPYGTKSAETVTRYAIECAGFLISKGVKLIVVACNSASAHAIPALRETYTDVPILGVVEAGARAALARTITGSIGVLGTEGTIKSGAYANVLARLNPRVRTLAQPCPLFVPLVEEGWLDDPITQQVAQRYLRPLLPTGHEAHCGERCDTVILGCTHYPLLKPVLARVLGPDVGLVDSADEMAIEVESLCDKRELSAPADRRGEYDFFVSDLSDRFLRIAERILECPMDRLAAVTVGDSYAPREAAKAHVG